jgi:cytochrome P450
MTEVAQETIDGWKVGGPGRTIDMMHEMMRLTLDVACRSLFSVDIRGEAAAVARALDFLVADFTFRFERPLYPPANRFPTPRNRQYLAAIAELDRVVYAMIADRRRTGTAGFDDMLSLLLDARDEETGQSMTDKQIHDELITLLIAGHETTAVALTWALYLLALHPQVEQRMLAELDDVLSGQPPSAADYPRLEYTRRVVDEAMRLYPPVWITNRQVLADDVVCGYRIPAGSMVSVSPYVVQRLERWWEQPEVFDPDRFLPERSAGRPAYAYFPFGGGPRLCIGKSFALVEAALVLACIVQQTRMNVAPGYVAQPNPVATLRPKGGMPLVVEFR